MSRRKVPGRFDSVPAGQVSANAGKFPVVRRQDSDTAPPGIQHIYMSLQGVYAVGVQHHRLFRLTQQFADQPGHPVAPAQAGAKCQHITGIQLIQNSL